MSGNYYYLVSSLPVLRLDDYKEPYRVHEFVSELREHLSAKHFSFIQDILYLYDIGNIVDILSGAKALPRHQRGNWEHAELVRSIEDPEFEFDGSLNGFLSAFRRQKTAAGNVSRRQLENMIFDWYLKYMAKHENEFIREYFRFDIALRNILAALNKRKFGLKSADLIPYAGDLITAKLESSAQITDFGLSQEVGYLNGLLEVLFKPDLVHAEKYIDLIRWQRIDEINVFKYFEIDVLLGYLVKLMLVERWINLEEHRGRGNFDALARVPEERIYQ